MNDSLIRKFCSKDESREQLLNPFNIGRYTYATNAEVGIRIDKMYEYNKNPVLASAQGIICWGAMPTKTPWLDIPEVKKEVTEKCDQCNGTGENYPCPDCGGRCEISWTSDYGYDYEDTCHMCDGQGKVKGKCSACSGSGFFNMIDPTPIGSKHVNAFYLRLLKQLPGIKIAPEAVEYLKPIPFKFDEGIGIVMPMKV